MVLPKVKYLPFACLIVETISRKMVAHLINPIQSASSAEPKKHKPFLFCRIITATTPSYNRNPSPTPTLPLQSTHEQSPTNLE